MDVRGDFLGPQHGTTTITLKVIKNENFQMKFFDNFLSFTQNIRRAYPQ